MSTLTAHLPRGVDEDGGLVLTGEAPGTGLRMTSQPPRSRTAKWQRLCQDLTGARQRSASCGTSWSRKRHSSIRGRGSWTRGRPISMHRSAGARRWGLSCAGQCRFRAHAAQLRSRRNALDQDADAQKSQGEKLTARAAELDKRDSEVAARGREHEECARALAAQTRQADVRAGELAARGEELAAAALDLDRKQTALQAAAQARGKELDERQRVLDSLTNEVRVRGREADTRTAELDDAQRSARSASDRVGFAAGGPGGGG